MTTRRKKTARPLASQVVSTLFDHRFQQPDLLTWALTHRSLAYETNPETSPDPRSDNEQLEFLGDAILGLAVAESLFRRFPGSREGELTRLRASLVSRRHLGEVATRIALGDLLLLGRGEEQSGGRQKPALLANAIEAVIAALYLDGGLDAARAFIEKHIIEPALPELNLALKAGDTFSGAIGDHKSALQEYLQASGAGQPQYVLTAQSGPDHQKRFRVEVRIEDSEGASIALAESEGSTKKQAQQEAARIAIERLLSEKRSIEDDIVRGSTKDGFEV
ncbi:MULTISPECIES: ribonuclease III [Acidobacteriaceae]|uniref:ribonuclease III n=1 Tax=Acidobacteriaceae TaxID=204434 RepID=UPI00131CC03D|nr:MULTISPECIES: ribonuclease III [Acidobacteriaceae]MDW5267005.1 ribonuclease III [Edaphobacter sp.]